MKFTTYQSLCSLYTLYIVQYTLYGSDVLFSSPVVTIGFNTAAYTVLEDAGSINVTVSVLNGTLARNVVVTLSTESGDAATGNLMNTHFAL